MTKFILKNFVKQKIYNTYFSQQLLLNNMNKFISIITGILFAILIFITFNKSNYKQIYHGPNSNEFKTKIFKLDDKCYIFEPRVYLCPK